MQEDEDDYLVGSDDEDEDLCAGPVDSAKLGYTEFSTRDDVDAFFREFRDGLDETNIQAALGLMPSLLSFYSTKLAAAERAYTCAKEARKHIYGQLYLENKANAVRLNNKSTEKMLDAQVVVDQRYQTVLEDELDAEETRIDTKGLVEAIKMCHESARSRSSWLKAEMDLASAKIRTE